MTDERESVQKKTFTKWVNSHLSRVGCKIQDLYVDLRDGKMLIKLLEVLSGERLVSLHSLYHYVLHVYNIVLFIASSTVGDLLSGHRTLSSVAL